MLTRNAQPVDAPALAAFLNAELGDGMYSTAGIADDIAFEGSHVTAVDVDGSLAGAAISRLLVPADAGYYERFGPAVTGLFSRGTVGSFEGVAVAPAARRQGIGTALLDDALAWFRERHCTSAVAVSWISGRPGDSAGLFEGAHFIAGPTIPDFYLEDSLREGWACPACGGPCHCAARSYHLPL